MPKRNSEGNWTYLSERVPGYVDRHGLKGIRKRNARLLDELRACGDRTEAEAVQNRFVENNLPLARYVAEVYALSRNWKKEDVEDAFQECCLALTAYIKGKTKDNNIFSDGGYFSMAIYYSMTNRLKHLHGPDAEERKIKTVPYDEDAISPYATHKPDIAYLRDFIAKIPMEEREKTMLAWFYFGNEKHYVAQESAEDIAYFFGLVTGTVFNKLQKTREKLAKMGKMMLSGRYNTPTIEDFFTEE